MNSRFAAAVWPNEPDRFSAKPQRLIQRSQAGIYRKCGILQYFYKDNPTRRLASRQLPLAWVKSRQVRGRSG